MDTFGVTLTPNDEEEFLNACKDAGFVNVPPWIERDSLYNHGANLLLLSTIDLAETASTGPALPAASGPQAPSVLPASPVNTLPGLDMPLTVTVVDVQPSLPADQNVGRNRVVAGRERDSVLERGHVPDVRDYLGPGTAILAATSIAAVPATSVAARPAIPVAAIHVVPMATNPASPVAANPASPVAASPASPVAINLAIPDAATVSDTLSIQEQVARAKHAAEFRSATDSSKCEVFLYHNSAKSTPHGYNTWLEMPIEWGDLLQRLRVVWPNLTPREPGAKHCIVTEGNVLDADKTKYKDFRSGFGGHLPDLLDELRKRVDSNKNSRAWKINNKTYVGRLENYVSQLEETLKRTRDNFTAAIITDDPAHKQKLHEEASNLCEEVLGKRPTKRLRTTCTEQSGDAPCSPPPQRGRGRGRGSGRGHGRGRGRGRGASRGRGQ